MRAADDLVALERQDQEAAPGPESLHVQRPTAVPRHVEVVHPLDAGELSSRHAGLSTNPSVR